MDPTAEQPSDAWLLTPSTAPAAEPTQTTGPTEPAAEREPPSGRRTLVARAALAAAGLVAGAVGALVIGHDSAAAPLENEGSTSQSGPEDPSGHPRGPWRGSFPGGPGAPGGFAPGGPGATQQTQPSGVIDG